MALQTRWAEVEEAERNATRARRIAVRFPDWHPESWDQEELEEYLFLVGVKAPSSVNKYLGALSALGFKVKFKVEDETPKRVLDEEELERLDQRVREVQEELGESGKVHSFFYAILRDTGCRGMEEIQRLSPDDINWERRHLTLRTDKGNKGRRGRVVPMSDKVYQALCWWIHQGMPVPREASWRAFWSRVRLDKDNRPYDLRHTFCTRLIDGGLDDMAVMKIMGHTTLAQTKAYHHLTTRSFKKAAEALK